MIIIPAIYLVSGRAVSHYKGQSQQEVTFSADPLRSAHEFKNAGAKRIHLVNLDGSPNLKDGKAANRAIARRIAQETQMEVSYAEGVVSLNDISALFNAGIDYVSLNQFEELLLAEALRQFGPDKIFFTINTQKHIIIGRQGIEVMDYGRDLAEKGVKNIILRDIKAEGTFHPNFDEVERLVIGTPAKIFAFGGIASMDDLEILQRTGVSGAIISKAFFEKKLSIKECVDKFETEK